MNTETCCVQLMKNPLQESVLVVRSIFQTDRQAGKQIDRQRPAVWSWWGIPAGVCTSGQKQISVDCGCAAEAVPPVTTVFIVNFFFTSLWSFFLLLSQHLLLVSPLPVCVGFLLLSKSLFVISSLSVCSFFVFLFHVFFLFFFFFFNFIYLLRPIYLKTAVLTWPWVSWLEVQLQVQTNCSGRGSHLSDQW